MKVVKVIDSTELRGDSGRVYFAQITVGFAVFYSDIDPTKLENLCNHRWSLFRTYDKGIASNIFDAWKSNKI